MLDIIRAQICPAGTRKLWPLKVTVRHEYVVEEEKVTNTSTDCATPSTLIAVVDDGAVVLDVAGTRLKRIVPVVPLAQNTTSVRSYSLAAEF